MVTVQLLPQASETQVMLGLPWQVILTAPTAAVDDGPPRLKQEMGL